MRETRQPEPVLGRAKPDPWDAPGKGVDDKGDIDEASPRRDAGKVRPPQGVRARCPELPIDAIERTRGRCIADCGPDCLTPHDPLQTHRPHQARHGAAGDRDPFSAELSPDLPDAIDSEVLVVHAADLNLHRGIAMGPRRQPARIGAPGSVSMIRRRGDRQDAADRLDPVDGAMLVDKRDHGLNRRSSSAGQNMPTPSAGSRSPGAAHGSHARAP